MLGLGAGIPVRPSAVSKGADVVVAGGGPAGATISRLLAGLGARVVLLEKHRFPRAHVGESLTPSIIPVLDFVGVRTAVENAGFHRMAGHTVCWNDPQPRTSYYSDDRARRGFQAWRADFDRILLDHARQGGVGVVEGSAVGHVRLGADSVTVESDGREAIRARFFIDATGHAGLLARGGLRRNDDVFRTLAITGYWEGAKEPAGIDVANTVIEAYPDGMIWSVALHNGLRNVTVFVDREDAKEVRRAGLEVYYRAELSKAEHVSGRVAYARLVGAPQACDASPYTSASFGGDSHLLVGDSGLFIDPLSSEGVHKAMASAITGAAVVNTILQRPSMTGPALAFYEDAQRETYELHRRHSLRYYREEGRWPEHLFWRHRAAAAVSHEAPPAAAPQPRRDVAHVRLAPGISIVTRPVIEGPFVELRDVVTGPHHRRGLRFLDGVNVPELLEIVRSRSAVSDVVAAYSVKREGHRLAPEHVRRVLHRLCSEGVLLPRRPDETRSG